MSRAPLKMKQIADELDSIYQRDGVLDPEAVVAWAAKNKRSALHSRFQWDNTAAAREWRLLQARNLITEVEVTYSDGKKRQVYVSPIDARSNKGGGYKMLVDVLGDRQTRRKFLDQALAEYQRVSAKYTDLQELAGVRAAVTQAVRAVRGGAAGKARRARAA